MTHKFRLPDVGEGISEGEILKWLVDKGDKVEKEQDIARLSTDKAIVDIPSPKSGTIKELKYDENDNVEVGDVIVLIEEGEVDEKSEPVKEESREKVQEKDIDEPENKEETEEDNDFIGDDIFNDDGEGYAINSGDDTTEEKGESSDKTESTEENEKEQNSDDEESLGKSKEIKEGSKRNIARPEVRRIASENNIDLSEVEASSTNDDGYPLVTEEDIMNHISEDDTDETEISVKTDSDSSQSSSNTIKYQGIRKTIGDEMEFAYNKIPHVTHHDMAYTDTLPKLKRKLNEKYDVDITYTDILAKLVVESLKEHEIMNSELDTDKEEIIIKDDYNIGVATDTEHGLMVPVIENVDEKSIVEVSKEIKEKTQKARDMDLNPDDMKGSTFTITNIGVIGGEFATPIINNPNTATLAIGEMKERPVVNDNSEVVAKFSVPLSLSMDHRVIDGADAARFVNEVKEYIDSPFLW
jgi:pyruvate dehydrogenase E2 component (dihydrolipoamide acetyltransferase)